MSHLRNVESRTKTHRQKYITKENDEPSQFDAVLRGELTRAIREGRHPDTTIQHGFPSTSVKSNAQQVYLETEIRFNVVNDVGSSSVCTYNIKFDPSEMDPSKAKLIDFRPKYFEVRDGLVGVKVLGVFQDAMSKIYRKSLRLIKPHLQPLVNAMVFRPPGTYGNRDLGGSEYRKLAETSRWQNWKGGKTRRRRRRLRKNHRL
jgi:hypothetical protein